MKVSIRCPHCKSRAIARSSVEMTPLLREVFYSCTNLACGHTYVAMLEIVRTLSPSAIPDPAIQLPHSPRVCARKFDPQRPTP